MKNDTKMRDDLTTDDTLTPRNYKFNDEFNDDEIETSSRRAMRKPSRVFDALTASPRLSRAWLAVSFACLAIAAACFWFAKIDAAFVSAALGGVAWFMNLRGRFYRAASEKDR